MNSERNNTAVPPKSVLRFCNPSKWMRIIAKHSPLSSRPRANEQRQPAILPSVLDEVSTSNMGNTDKFTLILRSNSSISELSADSGTLYQESISTRSNSNHSSPLFQITHTEQDISSVSNPQSPHEAIENSLNIPRQNSSDIGPFETETIDPACHWYLDILHSPAFRTGCAALMVVGLVAVALSTCPVIVGTAASNVLMGGASTASLGSAGLAASLLYGFFRPTVGSRPQASSAATFGMG